MLPGTAGREIDLAGPNRQCDVDCFEPEALGIDHEPFELAGSASNATARKSQNNHCPSAITAEKMQILAPTSKKVMPSPSIMLTRRIANVSSRNKLLAWASRAAWYQPFSRCE